MLLQGDMQKNGQPLMWHVWWHVGVRRYHWVQQQQQQRQQQQHEDEAQAAESEQQQQQGAASAVSKSSKARSKQRSRKQAQQQQALAADQQAGLQPLSAGQLAALYADPAARYYAAGFAARQTAAYGVGLRARAALRTPHTFMYMHVDEMMRLGRVQAMLSELDFGLDQEDFNQQFNVLDDVLNEALEVRSLHIYLVRGMPHTEAALRP
jgi:hypothetical protein